MKSSKLFATLRLSLLLFVFVLIVSSCDNDEEDDNSRLISISTPENFMETPVYVIASTMDGEVIASKKLAKGETTTLSSTSYLENSFVLSIAVVFDEVEGNYFYGYSYVGVTRGIEASISTNVVGSIDFNTSTALQNLDSYSISSNGDYNYLDENNDFESLDISKNPTRLFIVKSNNGQQLGYLFPTTTYTNGQTANLNLAGTYSNFTSEIVNFSAETYYGVTVFGRPSATDFTEKYLVSQALDYGNQLTIQYPGNTFPAYASESFIAGDNFSFTAYNKASRSDFSLFNASAEVEVNNRTVSYDVTSEGKVVVFDVDMEGASQSEEMQWEIYAPAGLNQSFVIPQLPEEIANLFDSYNENNWVFDGELGVVVAEDVNTVTDYFVEETEGRLYNSKNIKYLNLYLDASAARGNVKARSEQKQKRVNLFNTKARLVRNFLKEIK